MINISSDINKIHSPGIDQSALSMSRRTLVASGLAACLPALTANSQSNPDAVGAISRIGHKIFLRLIADSTGNTMFSPLSMGLWMGMVAAGSAGATAAEFRAALGLSSDEYDNLIDAMSLLNQKLSGVLGLSVVNALAFKSNDKELFRPEYISKVRSSFNAHILDDATVTSVNNWISQNTNNLIKHMFEEIGLFTIISTIYFKGEWIRSANDKPMEVFHTGRFDLKNINAMTATFWRGPLISGFETFVKEYKGSSVSLIIAMPQNGIDIRKIAKDISSDFASNVNKYDSNGEFDVLHMPTFRCDTGPIKFISYLKHAGLETIFDSKTADFSKARDNNIPTIAIDELLQQNVISLDRFGTEAAAATGSSFRFTGGSRWGSERFIPIDRPFVFFLFERSTNVVLMQGIIEDPRWNPIRAVRAVRDAPDHPRNRDPVLTPPPHRSR